MAFIKNFIFLLKKFEKVEKTGIIFTKFSLRCTPSVILGFQSKKKVPNHCQPSPGQCFGTFFGDWSQTENLLKES